MQLLRLLGNNPCGGHRFINVFFRRLRLWPNHLLSSTFQVPQTRSTRHHSTAPPIEDLETDILYEEDLLTTPRLPNSTSSELARAYYKDLVGPRPRAFNDYMEQQGKRHRGGGGGGGSGYGKRSGDQNSNGRPAKKFKHFGRNEFKRAAKKDWEERKSEFDKTGKDPAAEGSDSRGGPKSNRYIEAATRAPRESVLGEEKEERRPKKKVAVLIGYCGTGYKGMQLNPPTKTIEGDLFDAFVKAGAISKANSDDPKKSSLVRCARTDKGVHAAGNVISLKLIIESPTVIEDINKQLVDQIRIWDIIPTTNGFSCYQFCDSRVYEYLVPTYCFLPPHPNSFIAKRMAKVAEEENDLEAWKDRYDDVPEFWENVAREVRQALEAEGYAEDIIQQILNSKAEDSDEQLPSLLDEMPQKKSKTVKTEIKEEEEPVKVELEDETVEDVKVKPEDAIMEDIKAETAPKTEEPAPSETDDKPKFVKGLTSARKLQKQIIMQQKRAFRIPPLRLARIRSAFELYEGNHCFHNFTIQKAFTDPSSRRFIRTFKVSDPIIIDDTEWLSLKVHGQSFMMHQIRKMVGMVMLTIRYGCPLERIEEAYGKVVVPIPKAPALGLLLDHPVFDTYNKKADQNERAHIDFAPHKDKIQEFKQKHIYDKLFMEEQKMNTFHAFLSFLDNFETNEFEYLTSRGMKALTEVHKKENKGGESSTKDVPLTALIDADDEDNEDNQDS